MGYYRDPTASAAIGNISKEYSRLEKNAKRLRERFRKGEISEEELKKAQAQFTGIYRHILTNVLEEEELKNVPYAEKKVLDYVRSMQTGFTAQSLAEYAKLRKAMAIWDKFNRAYDVKTISNIALELDESIEDTKEILLGGMPTMPFCLMQQFAMTKKVAK